MGDQLVVEASLNTCLDKASYPLYVTTHNLLPLPQHGREGAYVGGLRSKIVQARFLSQNGQGCLYAVLCDISRYNLKQQNETYTLNHRNCGHMNTVIPAIVRSHNFIVHSKQSEEV